MSPGPKLYGLLAKLNCLDRLGKLLRTPVRNNARLIVGDSHQLLADACRHLLQPEFDVVAIAGTGRELVQATLKLKPEGVILEVSLPQLNGLDAAEQIKRKLPATRLVFLSANRQPEIAAEAFRRGASGYLLKQSGSAEYLTGIRSAMSGESFLSPLIARETMEYLLYRPRQAVSSKQITPRQREILQLLMEGRSMKQVASVLGVETGTVAFHKYNMMQKLGITSNAELLKFAFTRSTLLSNKQLASVALRC